MLIIILSCLIGVCEATHAGHDAEDVVVSGVNTDLGGLCALNCGVRENELECGVIDSGEVACAGWLVLLWAKCEGVKVDACVWGSCVVLERLDEVKV